MTLDDVKRLFHATPPEFAPYLEYAYHLQYGDNRDATLAAEKLEPVVQAAVYAPRSVLPQDVVTAASKVFYHADVDVDLYMKGLLWRRFLAFMGVRQSGTVTGRLAYYQSRPKFPVYGKGWTSRTRRCLESALQIAAGA